MEFDINKNNDELLETIWKHKKKKKKLIVVTGIAQQLGSQIIFLTNQKKIHIWEFLWFTLVYSILQ
jgi:hypothetical protein